MACEQVSTELFGPDTTIIRPTYVIGPYDRSYRFTWWVDRLARGGTVLAPGDPDDPIQVIDARDQAAFVVSLLERSITGTFHTVSPAPPFGFGQMLEAIAAEVAPPGTRARLGRPASSCSSRASTALRCRCGPRARTTART